MEDAQVFVDPQADKGVPGVKPNTLTGMDAQQPLEHLTGDTVEKAVQEQPRRWS